MKFSPSGQHNSSSSSKKKVMESLKELSAFAILSSDVEQWEPGRIVRCPCGRYQHYYMNDDYTTKEFISLLPLPVALKDFVYEVAENFCETELHPLELDAEDYDDFEHEEEAEYAWSTVDEAKGECEKETSASFEEDAGVKSLQELSAKTLLRANVCQWRSRPMSRCACDRYKVMYENDYRTEDFISLLPLPDAVKEFVSEIAEKSCEDHRQSEAEEERYYSLDSEYETYNAFEFNGLSKCRCEDCLPIDDEVEQPGEKADPDKPDHEAEDKSDEEDSNANTDQGKKRKNEDDEGTTVKKSCAEIV